MNRPPRYYQNIQQRAGRFIQKKSKRKMEINEIKEILKSPRNKDLLSSLSLHESRLKLHTRTTVTQAETGRAVTEFFESYVKGLIPDDKYSIFRSLFRFPVLTVPETKAIFQKLERVFDGRNPVFDYNFTIPEHLSDWMQYRNDGFWRNEAFKAFKESINSIVVVDVPSEQTTPLPAPYAFILDVTAVVDIGLSKDGKTIQSICFRPDGDTEKLAFYDDEYYRVFNTKANDLNILETITEARHDLGYCPAAWFWNDKYGPLSAQLSKLDWLLFFMVSKMQLDLHGAYPIYSGYEVDCDFEMGEGETAYECDGGYLRFANAGRYLLSASGDGLRHCPKCRSKRISGAGSFVEVPAPQDASEPDLRNPVQILTIDRSSLDYNVQEVQRLISDIFVSVTGVNSEPINNQAVNEKQVFAGMESETNVLRSVAKGFERIQRWAEKTICLLRYGNISFRGLTINYGTEFHLMTADDIVSIYNALKKEGADSIVLDGIQDQYFETKYRNNPEQLQRQQILLDLDPFRHLTKAEVTALHDKGLIDTKDYILKANFSTLIRKFEREQTDILLFGAKQDDDKKVNAIKEVLYSYIEVPETIKTQ